MVRSQQLPGPRRSVVVRLRGSEIIEGLLFEREVIIINNKSVANDFVTPPTI